MGWKLFIAMMITLAIAWTTIGYQGWCSGYIYSIGDALNEPSIAKIRGELYVLRMMEISRSEILHSFGVR